MKKVLFSLVLGGILAASASAAPINVSVGFAGTLSANPNTIAIAGGQTSVLFPSTTFNNQTLVCTLASFCSGSTVTASATPFASGSAEVFTFNPGMTYTVTSAWSITQTGTLPGGFKTFAINTLGNYFDGTTTTQGNLNFTFQEPNSQVGQALFYTFSASGGTVPEPGSMALLGSGLVGLGFIARRRRK